VINQVPSEQDPEQSQPNILRWGENVRHVRHDAAADHHRSIAGIVGSTAGLEAKTREGRHGED
jgi:hypothetical protein